MKRRDFLRSSALAGAGLLIPFNPFKTLRQGTFTPLRRNTGIYTERGGTIGWLASEDALIAVDSQYPETVSNFIAGIKERSNRSVDYLINTHHHGDHTGGNAEFGDFATHIVAHEHVPDLQMKAAERRGEETVNNQRTAEITYSETWKQEVGDEIIHLSHRGPAHTGGDTVVYFEKANVAHLGDLVFNRAIPYIDPASGALISNWVTTLDEVTETLPADALYIFGHANPGFEVTGNKEDVLVMRNFLAEVLDYTRKGIAAGQSKEELQQKTVLDGFEDFRNPDWFLQLDFPIGVAYEELTAN